MSNEDYERYLDRFAEQLRTAASTASDRRARKRIVFGLSGSFTLVGAATAALLALGGGPAGDRVDVVAEARAALQPAGKIVHLVLVTHATLPGGRRVDGNRTETWTATAPPRWRLRQVLPNNGSGVFRNGRFRKLSGVQEFAYANGSQRAYTAKFDELRVQRGFSDRGPAATAPSLLGLGDEDPAVTLRAMLERGELRDAGERTVRGRKVRRLVGETGAPGAVIRTVPPAVIRTLVYDVDPETFAPLHGSLTNRVGRSPNTTRAITIRFDVIRYDLIPDTPQNAHLLRIRTTPRTKVIVRSAAALRRDQARMWVWRKRCRPQKRGNRLVCPAPPPTAIGGR